MLLSGGVSMGEYDLVEEVLQTLGAEFFFTGVKMQPGKPVVFGRLPERRRLPRAVLLWAAGKSGVDAGDVSLLCRADAAGDGWGCAALGPRFVQATLAEDVAGKPGLMRVLPARLTADRVRPEVKLVGWQGSGDLAANARANCYAVLPPEKERFAAGDVITVLLRE